MDTNFSADSGSHKDQFFKPKQAAAPAVCPASFTIRIRFLHSDPGRSLRKVSESVAVASCTQHHELYRNPLTAIVNGVWREAGSRWQTVIQRFRIRLPGLLRTAGVRNDRGLIRCYKTSGLYALQRQFTCLCEHSSAKQSRRLLVETLGCRVGLQPPRHDGVHVAFAQRGAVLITGLIFLVVLTLLGTAALQGTVLEEKMAGNLRDETLAFQAAEAALRSGERFLEQVTLPEFNGENGLYYFACSLASNSVEEDQDLGTCLSMPDLHTEMDWDASGRAIDVIVDSVTSQPRYVIEQLASVSLMGDGGSAQQSGSSLNARVFRVIARGVGGTEVATALLQSTYQR